MREATVTGRPDCTVAHVIGRFVADVNNKLDLAKVETKLKDDPSITLLVNNAGFASVAPLLDADIQKMEDMIALNTPSPAYESGMHPPLCF